jgi:hypothetical protein
MKASFQRLEWPREDVLGHVSELHLLTQRRQSLELMARYHIGLRAGSTPLSEKHLAAAQVSGRGQAAGRGESA